MNQHKNHYDKQSNMSLSDELKNVKFDWKG
ncbi:hypothetical protein J2R98_000153 [Alkalibacillus filiformis]|uniref:Uncharacterized protein n=1 Tax=Alkalibacillus filiformis TaxID=200990 RepID=A0ABU0DQ70_9BACI|nr:hypothetical protein [Alkalibacillus filiformis]